MSSINRTNDQLCLNFFCATAISLSIARAQNLLVYFSVVCFTTDGAFMLF